MHTGQALENINQVILHIQPVGLGTFNQTIEYSSEDKLDIPCEFSGKVSVTTYVNKAPGGLFALHICTAIPVTVTQ